MKNMVINTKKDIYVDLALFINKLMLDDCLIPYSLYKISADNIVNKN